METYLLTWNPNRWHWEMEHDLAALKRQGFFEGRWSCGQTKRINSGDRAYLLRQGREPRGIVASGDITSAPYLDRHWDEDRGGQALYVDVRFDALVNPEEDGVLPLSRLRRGELAHVNWRTQSSGISIPPTAAAQLDPLWRAFLEQRGQSPVLLPDEVAAPSHYYEGASRTISVNAYERDPRARRDCIAHYGSTCFVCGFDFESTYGEIGAGYIHVHHVVPLSQIRKTYRSDPVKDLRPVCPNCHAMLHRGDGVLTVKELKGILQRRSSNTRMHSAVRKSGARG